MARVGDMYLYRANISGLINEESSLEDSTKLAQAFVESWVRQQLVINEAERKLSPEQKDFSQKLEEYRLSLLRYRFETEIVAPQVDTSVDWNLIETYYYANREQFKLKRPLLKGKYVKLEIQAPKQENFKKWLLSKREKELGLLEDYCFQYAFNFQLVDSTWLLDDALLRGMPAELSQQFDFSKKDVLQVVEDNTFRYYLLVRDYLAAGTDAPLAFEVENVKSLLLLQRRQEHINRYYQDLYRIAQKEKRFEIY